MKLTLRYSPLLTLTICMVWFACALPLNCLAQGQSLRELQNLSAEGNRDAQNLLALRHFKGDQVRQNNSRAAELFAMAAKQGLKKAQFNLAYMYHHGMGLPQDYTLACVWYKAAADQGHSEARKSLNELLQYTSSENLQEIDELHSEIIGR